MKDKVTIEFKEERLFWNKFPITKMDIYKPEQKPYDKRDGYYYWSKFVTYYDVHGEVETFEDGGPCFGGLVGDAVSVLEGDETILRIHDLFYTLMVLEREKSEEAMNSNRKFFFWHGISVERELRDLIYNGEVTTEREIATRIKEDYEEALAKWRVERDECIKRDARILRGTGKWARVFYHVLFWFLFIFYLAPALHGGWTYFGETTLPKIVENLSKIF